MKWWTISLIIIAVLCSACRKEERGLLVFAGAGLKEPLQEIALEFEADNGIRVAYNFAGCGQHLSQMEMSSDGDVFIAGSDYHAELALDKGLIEEIRPLAYHIPVIAIRNSCQIAFEGLDDLQKEELVIGFGDPEATAIGKLSWTIINNTEISEAMKVKEVVYTSTVNELMTHLEMGTIDVAIVWEDLTHNKEEINVIQIPEAFNQIEIIPGAVINKSDHWNESQRFIEYLCSETGESIFENHGFKAVKNEQ